ncbi:MAG: tagaturonate epimerase family protein [Chloroflexi bacterium]|nr:tagaturonate epimerase family protein [Chloroflexota bacterium]MCI0578410.1 tagaturonate epimerase family protein [Chloroflexota bacterium]MCI0648150.1 tagaturonate epimerase family protein [Chloroflexota bacterium]MCI0726665.1 tagaturonate epimerase family protein [Chloroflexota bacterium]
MTGINISEGTIYPKSVVTQGETTYFLIKMHENGERRLGIVGDAAGFGGPAVAGIQHTRYPLTPPNAAALRACLPWLNPVPLELKTSFGFGDRMGSATPGHILALWSADPGGKIAPIFAQQSVRENARTGRTPQQVMDDATWGIFQEGWRAPWGADADHVKEVADLAPFVAAGYTFFTVDPSDHVDNAAQTDSPETLRTKTATLPWDTLQSSYDDMHRRYCREPLELGGLTLAFDEAILRRALAKYGRALAHTMTIAHELTSQMDSKPYDLEMSVDETDTPTSVHEHFFIANELNRSAVPVVSVAPRFVGKFQKGVDYIGDLVEFESELARHAAIMRHFGSYKLSIHTGSDKFSIYPAIARHTQGLVHVKTAGTSYLEAVRVAAQNPPLFRRILDLARARFEKDRKTYFLDAQLSKVPENGALADASLPELLDQFDARQVLHVTFGSILDEFGAELDDFISQHEADYRAALEAHFVRHLEPFV